MIRRLVGILCAAIVLAACESVEVAKPRSMEPAPKMFPIVFSDDPEKEPSEPPNVAAAEAEEEWILSQLAPPGEARDRLLARLRTPDVVIGATSSARISDLLSRYFAARRRTIRERRRQASLDAASGRGINVVIVLGTPTAGSLASVRPSYSVDPVDIIVIGPQATAQVLSDALAFIEKVRAREGYEPHSTHEVELVEPRVWRMDAAREQEMEQLLEQLRTAPMRAIEGVGTARAIDVRTRPLLPPPAPPE